MLFRSDQAILVVNRVGAGIAGKADHDNGVGGEVSQRMSGAIRAGKIFPVWCGVTNSEFLIVLRDCVSGEEWQCSKQCQQKVRQHENTVAGGLPEGESADGWKSDLSRIGGNCNSKGGFRKARSAVSAKTAVGRELSQESG